MVVVHRGERMFKKKEDMANNLHNIKNAQNVLVHA